MPMSAVKSFNLIKKAFLLGPFTDSLHLKCLKFLLQMISGWDPDSHCYSMNSFPKCVMVILLKVYVDDII